MRRRERVASVRPKIVLRSGIGAGVAVAVPATGALMATPALAAPGAPGATTPGSPTTPSAGTAATTVKPVLYIGSRGEAVKAIQSTLGVTTTGYFGPVTQAAVKAFQRSNGLVADGVVGALTWAKITGAGSSAGSTTKPTTGSPTKPTTGTSTSTPRPTTGTTPGSSAPATTCSATATTLRYGSTHQLVKVLQGRLGLVVDGWFGPQTRAKVVAFQQANGLVADGVVGPLTWAKLGCASPSGTSAPTPPSTPTTPPTVPTSPTTPSSPTTPPATSSSAKLAQIIALGKSFSGTPYVWGGSTPAGFDCSGLTSYIFRQYGITMPRTAAQQQAYFPRTSTPKPGDLLFYGYPAYHVAVYLGDGMMLDAPHPGGTVGVRAIYGTPAGYASVLS